MKLKVLYGNKKINLKIPDDKAVSILDTASMKYYGTEEEVIKEALCNPIGTLSLAEIVCPGETACIIIGDVTRLWVRHDKFIPYILNELNLGGIKDEDIIILSATGDHRRQSPEVHLQLVGEEAFKRVEVYDYDSRNENELVYFGVTTYGTPVRFNSKAVDADRIIIAGAVVYHFLAGWGGGKKAVLPGIAGRDTIMSNHSLAFKLGDGWGLNPDVRAGSMEGNPCCEDMIEGTSLLSPNFLFNVVINEENSYIGRAFSGHFVHAHKSACDFVDSLFRVSIEKKYEIVIASCGGYPKDINLYQTYKTIYNAHLALEKGGTLLLVSSCNEGVGNDQFFEILSDYKDNFEREAALRHNYSIGGHMGYHLAVIATENDLLIKSDLSNEIVKPMGMIPVKSIDDGLEWIKNKHGNNPHYCIMPHGASIYLV